MGSERRMELGEPMSGEGYRVRRSYASSTGAMLIGDELRCEPCVFSDEAYIL
jgi:hypothetical protein